MSGPIPAGWRFLASSVHENEALVAGDAIDFSADTCVDYCMVAGRRNFQVEDTGLWSALIPCTESPVVFKAAVADLNNLVVDLADLSKDMSHFQDVDAPHSNPDLVICYDDFHPNRLVCDRIALHLEQKGWKVNLVQDNYYKPNLPGDCKFVIRRPAVNSNIFKSYSLLRIATTEEQQLHLLKTISALENQAQVNLDELMTDLGVAKPIVPIPSIYWSRNGAKANPLTRNLR